MKNHKGNVERLSAVLAMSHPSVVPRPFQTRKASYRKLGTGQGLTAKLVSFIANLIYDG